MSVDLIRYIDFVDRPQPEALRGGYARLCVELRKSKQEKDWDRVIQGHMLEVRSWIQTGLIDGSNAAGALFAWHALAAGFRASGFEGGVRILGFVTQLSLTEEMWIQTLSAMAADGLGDGTDHRGVLRVDTFPDEVLASLIRRGQLGILRELFRGARSGIDGAARRAMSSARDFNEWVGDLAVLASYLTMRRWLPLSIGTTESGLGEIEIDTAEDGRAVGGRFKAPSGSENPILAHLFVREEIDTLRRKEAFAAECFAHLFASILSGSITHEHQSKMAEEYSRRVISGRLDAREWLALGKSRFEIAPYIRIE